MEVMGQFPADPGEMTVEPTPKGRAIKYHNSAPLLIQLSATLVQARR